MDCHEKKDEVWRRALCCWTRWTRGESLWEEFMVPMGLSRYRLASVQSPLTPTYDSAGCLGSPMATDFVHRLPSTLSWGSVLGLIGRRRSVALRSTRLPAPTTFFPLPSRDRWDVERWQPLGRLAERSTEPGATEEARSEPGPTALM